MEFVRHARLNSIWLKAAVTGSLWASVEIVAGSFLHNLQVPFTGTILTAFAILLLSAFSRLWNESGIIWRAGLICALMKSISPSAVIIGPMVGIITESFLFELLLIILGRNFIGTIAGGAITAVSAIIHKFFTLLILYGFDFVRILESLYQYAVKQLNIPNVHAIDLIGILAALYGFIGIMAASIGFFIGNNFTGKDVKSETLQTIRIRSENQLFDLPEKQNFSALLILVNLMVMIAVLWLLNLNYFIAAWSIALLFAGFCIYRYPNALRRFKKISVWLQFLIIVLTSILVWDVFKTDEPNGESGWSIGLAMIFRAILLIIGFAAISVELKNPLVKTVLYKRGLSNLYQSVTMAFGVLPDLVASLSKSKLSILNPVNLLSHLLRTSQNLIELFKEEQNNLPAIFIITGEVGEGKTTFVEALTRKLQNQDCRSGGFLSVGIEEESERAGYKLVDIRTQESILLCSKKFQLGWAQTGRFFFNPDAIEFGSRVLNPLNLKEINLIVIDEMGFLEMNNRGWAPAIERLSSNLSTPQLWIVRKNLVHKMVRKWNVGDIYIFDVAHDSVEFIENTILSHL